MSQGRPWDGARDPNCDYFDDVMGDNDTVGIFQGGAMERREKVAKKKTREGLQTALDCRYCNASCKVMFEWPELFIVAMLPTTSQLWQGGLLPQGWKHSEVNGSVYPEVPCNKCGGIIGVHFTPDIAQREIEGAIKSGVISEQWLQQQPAVASLLGQVGQAQQALQQQQHPGG